MSVPVFLQGKLLGLEDFLLAPARDQNTPGDALQAGRAHWITLLTEVLPRALLAELGLARILLGSSGGGAFLLVLPAESRQSADEFLSAAASRIAEMSGGRLRLAWAVTENLGDWTDVRKRLAEDMARRTNASFEAADENAFAPTAASGPDFDDYFVTGMASARDAVTVGWSPDDPARILFGTGKHTWLLGGSSESIPIARHVALSDDGAPASLEMLAGRASGRPLWGVLRAAVDDFDVRMRRASSDAEFIQSTLLFRQFFAGELDMACSMPEFWRRVTILYSGIDDFAVYGSWDALLLLAREMQRVFHRFADANLKELPGPEGKTITMALAIAPPAGASFQRIWEQATRDLDSARAAAKDSLHIFGRAIDWRQVAHAADLRETMLRMVLEFGCPPEFLDELTRFYRDKPSITGSSRRLDRPWRYHRRFNSVLSGAPRDREFQRIRTALITDLIGKSAAQVKLRPAGGLAVHWARLSLDAGSDPASASPTPVQ